jgi:hypothetical protein
MVGQNPRSELSGLRGSIFNMSAARVFGRVGLDLLLLALELVLLPVRVAASLLGGLLLISGLFGLPAWLIQLTISLAGGKDGGGPLAPWEMCAMLAVAVPVGIALIEFGGLGIGDGIESSERIAQPVEPILAGAPEVVDATHQRVDTGRNGATDFPYPLGRIELMRKAHSTRLAHHQLRVRRASRTVTRGRRLRRGGH